MQFYFFFDIEPRQKDRPRFNFKQRRAYSTCEQEKYEWLICNMARQQLLQWPRFRPLKGALAITLVFAVKRPKSVKARPWPCVVPDLDNLIKSLDAFNGQIWKDDAQIVIFDARKIYADANNPVGMTMVVNSLEAEKNT